MVKETMRTTLTLYRPSVPQKTTSGVTEQSVVGTRSFTKADVIGVKLAQSSEAWSVSTDSTTKSKTATLYFNIGISYQSPALTPTFKVGDILTAKSTATTPSDEQFIVSSITEQTFKGKLHHYEVVLV